MRHPQTQIIEHKSSGYWRIFVDPIPFNTKTSKTEVTVFRGAPTTVNSLSTTDPFGPAQASLTFPAITLFDSPGSGDLNWLVPEANVDICWMAPKESETDEDIELYRWEGYFLSFEYGEDDAGGTLTIQCNGAMRQLDNFLATPEYLVNPLSYEEAISRQFSKIARPSLRTKDLKPFSQCVPDWWNVIFKSSDYSNKGSWFLPTGPTDGKAWSGLVTRSTGNFDSALTSYIQALLSSMQTSKGRFSLMLDKGREPVFVHRERLTQADDETLFVDLIWPGVTLSITRDFSQKLNAVYGKGKGLDGNAFSNLQFSPDGTDAHFEPFAIRKQVDTTPGNVWYDPNIMRKEVNLTFYDGLEQEDATEVAIKHLETFNDPGFTGSLTLKTDPTLNGELFPRQMITAGMNILIKGLFGDPIGTVFHITETNLSSDNSLSITLDSKFRDQLTVQEVRKRGRDSLTISRLLEVGKYQQNIDDIMFPWASSSGFLPTKSYAMWTEAIKDSNQNPPTVSNDKFTFPWTFPSVKKYMPGRPENKGKYVKLGPASGNADNNWAGPIPIRLSAAGQIILFQVVAYDSQGKIMKVPFHISLYYNDSVSAFAMPAIPASKLATKIITNNAKVTVPSASSGGYKTVTISNLPTGHPFSKSEYIWIDAKSRTTQKTDGRFVVESSSTNSVTVKMLDTVPTVSNLICTVSSAQKKVYGDNGGIVYDAGDHFPFFAEAWETVRQDGGSYLDQFNVPSQGVEPIVGWGTYYEKPGYWPGSSPAQNNGAYLTTPPTGIFSEETSFGYSFRDIPGGFNSQDSLATIQASGTTDSKKKSAAIRHISAYAMIYCDQMWDDSTQQLVKRTKDVYFLARAYRQIPGQ